MIYFFAVVYGFSYGGKTPLLPGLIGLMFPGASLATIIGAIHGLALTGGALGPIIGGVVYDATKSYDVAFIIGAFFWAAAGLLLFFAKMPDKQKVVQTGDKPRILIENWKGLVRREETHLPVLFNGFKKGSLVMVQ